MKKVELFIVPYAKENEIKTRLVVDGNEIDSKDNRLTNLVVYQPMRKWLNPYIRKLFVWDGLLAEVIEEFNDKSIHLVFHGCKADYTLFKKSILLQQMKLNRNGGAVDVTFEIVDKWNPKKTVKELVDVLDDLRVEADNWSEDGIIKEIDHIKDEVCNCKVLLKTEYHSSPTEFQNLLLKQHIGVQSDSVLTIIPVDGCASVSGIRDFVKSLIGENNADGKYMVVNTSMQENDALSDAIIPLDGGNDLNVMYIENDGENYIQEIEKMYYLSVLPGSVQKTIEILQRFPDHDTNSFLIDISDRIEYLFHIAL